MQGENTPHQARNGIYQQPQPQQINPFFQPVQLNYNLVQQLSNGNGFQGMFQMIPNQNLQHEPQQQMMQPHVIVPFVNSSVPNHVELQTSQNPQIHHHQLQQHLLQQQLLQQQQQIQQQQIQQARAAQQQQLAQKQQIQQAQQQQAQHQTQQAQQTHQQKALQQPQQEVKEKKEKLPKVKIPKKVPAETQLKELVDARSAIAKPEFVQQFIKLMEEEKLSQKVKQLMLNTLRVTNKNCLDKFLELGGVNCLRIWLEDANENNKVKIVQQILDTLAKLPMTISCLLSSEIGKTVKGLVKTHQSNEQLRIRMETLLKQWRRLAEKQKDPVSETKPKIKETKVVKAEDSDGGIFSALSGSSIPKKSKTASAASLTIPKHSRTEAKKPVRSAHTMEVNVNAQRSRPQNGVKLEEKKPNIPKVSTPVKRKADEMEDETPTKRPRLSPPAVTHPSGPKKRRVTWSAQLEHVKIFEKELPIDESEMDQQKQQQAQQQQQAHGYNQDHLSEKLFFTQQREEKRRRLEQMNATTHWYQPLPIANLNHLVERGQDSQEAAIRRAENLNRQPVVYLHPSDIPASPGSPLREDTVKNILDPNLLSTICSVLSSTPKPPASNPNINQYMNHNQPALQMHGAPQQYPPANMFPQNQPPLNGLSAQNIAAAALASINNNRSAANQMQFKASKAIRCRFYGTKVGCRNGANCPFFHHGIDPIPPGGVKEFDPEIAKQVQEARAKQRPTQPQMPLQPPQPNPYSAMNGMNGSGSGNSYRSNANNPTNSSRGSSYR